MRFKLLIAFVDDHKTESILVIEGRLLLHLEGEDGEVHVHALDPGEYAHVPRGRVHRFEAELDTKLVEVSTPELDDVVRLEDDFGREGHCGAELLVGHVAIPWSRPLFSKLALERVPVYHACGWRIRSLP